MGIAAETDWIGKLQAWGQWLWAHPTEAVYCFVGIVLFSVLMYAIVALRKNPQAIVLFTHDRGSVLTTRKALTGLIARIAKDAGAQGFPKVKLKTRADGLSIVIRAKLFTDQKVELFNALLQERLNETLKEQLGIPLIAKINILITSFLKRPS